MAHHRIRTIIASHHTGFKKELEFLIVPRICSLLPSEQIDRDLLSIPHNIRLADPEFHKPAPVQALIGSGTALSILSVGQLKVPHTSNVYLQKTLLGWIIAGHITLESNTTSSHCHVTQMINDFRKFWEIEDIHPTEVTYSDEERACLDHFRQHVSRTPQGRYVVALPFTDRKDQLGSSKLQAKRQLLALERRFKANPEFHRQYSEVIEEYLQLGHMQLVKNDDELDEGFYLPHHGVIKETSHTTKLRVVFNASARSSTQLSLNDVLMVGPIQQDNIFILILRFRMFKYVFTGDIEKMYRQVLISPEDRKYQRILWRINGIIRVLELLTVTFGVASAPHLAVNTLLQLADDEGKSFPLAAEAIRKNTYVDDILAGADTLQEATELRDQLFNLLKAGGFNLRQCASNSPELLQDLPDCTINLQLLGGDDATLKTLGVYWDSATDSIIYTVNPITTRERITMRTIASDIARIYDPLGLVNPVIAHAKIIQQELWRLKLDWDESVPEDIQTRWNDFIHQLPLLNQIRFNRRVIGDNQERIELHGFCDASERAYGACIYLRSVDQAGDSSVQLLCAKSRITPLKGSYTIPRLELCAAELLIKLYTTIINSLHLQLDQLVFWSDSTVTLHWIKTSPHRLQRFVANRVSKIQQHSEPEHWRHVRTHENPADALSRGQLTTDFIQNSLWQHGPDWLQEEEDHWPELTIIQPDNPPELKKVICLHTTESSTLFKRFSSFEHLRRFVAYCLRWKGRALKHHKETLNHPSLTMAELDSADVKILHCIQSEVFSTELGKLTKGQSLPSNSRLLNLSPILDSDGLLRVGGRLNKATTLSFNERHPILLPKGHHVTQLIIRQIHCRNLHPGVQTTLHLIRQRYWPIDGRNQVRHIIRKCVRCFRVNPTTVNYPMSDLPKERITFANPFTHTGVDYCGPLFIKEKRHRNRNKLKVWICIFMCFSTKAVHIEVVNDISTEEFLAALSRFISRHPACQTLHSDNGTNFVGANNELKELYTFLNDQAHRETITHELLQQRIKWDFIPPASPHCGGLWEAAVRSFKHHFRRVVGNELLTFQQLNTLCIKIEGILNSRPLRPLSSDPNDYAALTPAHFLHGQSSNDLPAPDWTETPSNRLSYWQHIEKIKQHFWTRWYKEYLNELNIRHKWMDGEHSLNTGSLVLLKDNNLPPLKWKLGRIIEVYPSSDNVIRKVKVRTASGTVDRNVRRLAPLPVDINETATS